MSEPKLSILMVNWNTCDMTLACLDSIYKSINNISFEIILVDNGSHDGSADAIMKKFPQVVLIRSDKNLGFGAGTNLAAERAKGKYLLLLNTDTVVLDNAIEKLCKFAADNSKAGIWGGRTLFADGNLNPTSCWQKPSLWSIFCISFGLAKLFQKSEFFNSEAYGNWKRDTVRQVDIVSGCFLLIGRDLWQCLHGLHSDFFMYGEEADLCIRAGKKGVLPLFTPEATIIHYGGASTKLSSDKAIYIFGARIGLTQRYLRKSHSFLCQKFILSAVFLRMAASAIIKMVKREKTEQYQHWLRIFNKRDIWLSGPLRKRL